MKDPRKNPRVTTADDPRSRPMDDPPPRPVDERGAADRLRTNDVRPDDRMGTADIAHRGNEPARQREEEARRADEANAARRSREVERARERTAGDGHAHDAYRPPGDGGRPGAPAEARSELFTPEALQDFRSRWTRIQSGFVDEPRRSVQEADHLVAETVQRLAESFATQRSQLEQQWDRGDQVSTEDLRQTLRHYRSFFERLLSL